VRVQHLKFKIILKLRSAARIDDDDICSAEFVTLHDNGLKRVNSPSIARQCLERVTLVHRPSQRITVSAQPYWKELVYATLEERELTYHWHDDIALSFFNACTKNAEPVQELKSLCL
jgi:hypothetical protein